MRDFTDIYYESVECIRCNLCLDKCPVVRAAGIDAAPLYASVYSAMGTRFDLDMTAEESFQCIDCYECEAVCPVEVPIADTMKYVRKLSIESGKVPEAAMKVIEKAKDGMNILGTPAEQKKGKAEVALFLGYAGELDENTAHAFGKICKASGIEYTVISGAADSGYLLDSAGFEEDAKASVEKNVKLFDEAEVKVVVTPCSFSYEAFVKLYPHKFKFKHISQFVSELMADGKLKLEENGKKVAYHDPHFLTRVNGIEAEPRSIIKAVSGEKAAEPVRTGAKTSSCGIGGGLGLFNEEIMGLVNKNRAEELAKLGCDTVVSGCIFENYALKAELAAIGINAVDLTQYVAEAIK